MGHQSGKGKMVYHSGTVFEGQFKESRLQYGVLRIGTEEFAASLEEAGVGSGGK